MPGHAAARDLITGDTLRIQVTLARPPTTVPGGPATSAGGTATDVATVEVETSGTRRRRADTCRQHHQPDAERDAQRDGDQDAELHRDPAGRAGTPRSGRRRRTGPSRWTAVRRPERRRGSDPARSPGRGVAARTTVRITSDGATSTPRSEMPRPRHRRPPATPRRQTLQPSPTAPVHHDADARRPMEPEPEPLADDAPGSCRPRRHRRDLADVEEALGAAGRRHLQRRRAPGDPRTAGPIRARRRRRRRWDHLGVG